jgi:hypothetical protein
VDKTSYQEEVALFLLLNDYDDYDDSGGGGGRTKGDDEMRNGRHERRITEISIEFLEDFKGKKPHGNPELRWKY